MAEAEVVVDDKVAAGADTLLADAGKTDDAGKATDGKAEAAAAAKGYNEAKAAKGAAKAAPEAKGKAEKPADAGAADPGKTLLEGGGEDEKAKDGEPDPNAWRIRMTGGDEKAMKRIARFKSEAGVLKSFLELDAKFNSGALKPAEPFPEKGTDAEKTEWRAKAGVPETPAAYHDHLDGIVIGAEDKPLVDEFLAAAHARNENPEAVRGALDWYYKTQERVQAEKIKADQAYRRQSAGQLRAEWGGDMSQNLLDLKAWLVTEGPAGEEGDVPFNQLLFGARLADGTLLGDNPRALRFLEGLRRQHNSRATVNGAGEQDRAASVDARIAEIEKFMASNRDAYFADKAMVKEHRDLIDLRLKRSGGQAKDQGGEQAA